MTGYIIASIISDVSRGSETCLYIMCWRWPFFIEVALLVPLCVVLNSLPRAHFDLYTSKSLLERALPKTYVPSTCGTHKTGHNKSDSLNVIERAQDLHTDESYTPSSSSIRRSDQFESPDEINQSSTESHPILLHGTSGGYQELSPFPHRHSMESSDHPKSVNGSSPKSNYLPLQVYLKLVYIYYSILTLILLYVCNRWKHIRIRKSNDLIVTGCDKTQ